MADRDRKPPNGRKASLFITCLVDMLQPQIGLSVVQLLEHLGVEIDFPQGQTCCGQPAFNAGYWQEARQIADHFLDVFEDADVVVTPSGSCAAMVRHEYPRLYADDPEQRRRAQRLAAITWELSEYIVDGLGIDELNASLPEQQQFAFHDGCHGLRLLDLGDQARSLVASVNNATTAEMDDPDVCCGFGGLFSVKMAAVSGSMLQQKIDAVERCPAQVLCGDLSCMLHINGGLQQADSPKRVRHFAEVLAQGVANGNSE